MESWARIGTLTACVALAFGCDDQTEVQRQTHDLQEAQKNVAKERQQLEGELERAKADVARLEQKVALARQGLTDDVLENQKELQAALQAQEHKVESELGDAKREAQIHARDTEAALKTLGGETAGAAPDERVPVKGTDPVPEAMPEPEPAAPPPAPPQPTSPITDPTGALPPAPPPAAPQGEVAPSTPAPPAAPAPTQP